MSHNTWKEIVNHEISTQATSILKIFGHEQLSDLYINMAMLVEIWRVDGDECKTEFDKDDEAQLINLLRSAILLSKIADMHSKKFDKISHKYWNFWKKCEKIGSEQEN